MLWILILLLTITNAVYVNETGNINYGLLLILVGTLLPKFKELFHKRN